LTCVQSVCKDAYRCLPRWTAGVALTAALAHVFIAMSFLGHGPLLSVEGSVIVWVPALLFVWLVAVSGAVLRASATSAQMSYRIDA
jgi:hypothetical protein